TRERWITSRANAAAQSRDAAFARVSFLLLFLRLPQRFAARSLLAVRFQQLLMVAAQRLRDGIAGDVDVVPHFLGQASDPADAVFRQRMRAEKLRNLPAPARFGLLSLPRLDLLQGVRQAHRIVPGAGGKEKAQLVRLVLRLPAVAGAHQSVAEAGQLRRVFPLMGLDLVDQEVKKQD